MMRPLPFVSAGAAPSIVLRLLLSLLMLAMFVFNGQAVAQEAPSEATAMRLPPPPEEGDPPYNNASMVTQAVPSSMVVGALYNVSISMRNTGTTTWYGATGHRLASVTPLMNTTWGLSRVELPTSQTGPGNTATFNFQVRAPSAPGTYTFQWQMLQEGVEWFGVPSNPVTITVREPLNNAQPWAQSVPTQMEVGKRYDVSVSVYNNGESTWTRAQNYTLMSQSPQNNMTWGLNRVALPFESIAPENGVTFTFQITAPSSPGSYVFQWGMQRETYGSFGPGTSPVTVNVVAPPPLVNNAQVVGMTVPNRMITGNTYNVAVIMQNTGTTTWSPGANYRLGSQNPHDNFIWGMHRVALGSTVAPGQSYTFSFPVTAPTAGAYTMQWGMVQDGVEWFGASAGSPVTVTENLGNVTFIHTDGLGSPVARTDSTGNVVSRTRYEPYGFTASGAAPTIGFTGHVNDADTGLTYMQQRYYDPVAGRFLSVDPVVTDANTGGSFNRYTYVLNNPYRYIDPDGREGEQVLKTGIKIVLKLKDTWTRAQIVAAEKKAAHLDSLAKSDLLQKTESASGPSASKIFKGDKPTGSDIDHMQDKQLGGHPTDLSNLAPLDTSVNRSFGAQIGAQLRRVPVGTLVTAVSILYTDVASAMTNVTFKDVASGIADFVVDPASSGGCSGSGKCSSEMFDPKTGP